MTRTEVFQVTWADGKLSSVDEQRLLGNFVKITIAIGILGILKAVDLIRHSPRTNNRSSGGPTDKAFFFYGVNRTSMRKTMSCQKGSPTS